MLREIVDQSIHIHLLPISTRENALLSTWPRVACRTSGLRLALANIELSTSWREFSWKRGSSIEG